MERLDSLSVLSASPPLGHPQVHDESINFMDFGLRENVAMLTVLRVAGTAKWVL